VAAAGKAPRNGGAGGIMTWGVSGQMSRHPRKAGIAAAHSACSDGARERRRACSDNYGGMDATRRGASEMSASELIQSALFARKRGKQAPSRRTSACAACAKHPLLRMRPAPAAGRARKPR